jgi:non-specific serine/threonine protein kinase
MGVIDVTFYLAAATALQDQAERSAQLCEDAVASCDARGERWLKSYLLWDLGLVAWQLGNTERAAASGREALRLARAFNEQWVIAFCIEILAWTAHADLKDRRAARLLGSAEGFWRRVGAPLFGMEHLVRQHRRCLDEVRQNLGEDAFELAFRSGMTMDSDPAIAYALEEPAPASDTPGAAPDVVLTQREMEVAALVAEGLSNKEIALKLVISQRTAEAHVGHILEKLSFSSRSQVAAWVAERRAFKNAAG